MELQSVVSIAPPSSPRPRFNSNEDHFIPTSISWHNIDVFTKYKKKFYELKKNVIQKQILNQVSGVVKSGQFLAIMGSSGAGKTTLLNVLTAINLSEVSVKGVVKLNGQLAKAKDIKRISAYVQQYDLFIPVLTAALRLAQNMNAQQRHTRVEEVMKELSLTKCSETRIGSNTTFKGISGGESKRLAFASELLMKPSLLFCDEPTSGLDSFMAESIVNVMKSMASKGRTVICTIHQPSSQTFELFDQLLLMADGRVAYMGSREEALNYFSSIDLDCLSSFNPADFLIKELSILPEREDECRNKIHSICDRFMNSEYRVPPINELSSQSSFDLPSTNAKNVSSRYRTSFWKQLSLLIWRSFLENSRKPGFLLPMVYAVIVVSLIMGVIDYHQPLSQTYISNIGGIIYLSLTGISMTLMLRVIQTFTFSFPMFIREHKNMLYRVYTFYLSTVIVQLPFLVFVPILGSCVYYYMIQLNPSGVAFILHLVLVILCTYCSVSLGYFLSCVSGSHTVVNALLMPVNLLMSVFCGYLINSSTFPKWLIWVKYVTFYHYGYEGIMINQWQDIDYIPCDGLSQCLSNGIEVINYYGFSQKDFVLDFIVLIVMSIGFQFLAFISLYIRASKVK